jgi:hypothetical protein
MAVNARRYYEMGMECFYQGDYINSVIWSERCLNDAPDWAYSFLAMHSIAAAYHHAGLLVMADMWARRTIQTAPFFELTRSFLLPY